MKSKAFLRDRLFVPAEYVTEDMLRLFETPMEIGKDPFTKEPIIQTEQHYQFIQSTADTAFYAFNRGNMHKIMHTFGPHFEIEDQRIEVPMQHDLKVVLPDGVDFYEYQPDAIEALLACEYGVLKAPARSGKTVILTTAICAERQKTLVFAHQTDLLVQALSTFEKFTNLLELRLRTGKKIVGLAETWEDFEELDVVFCTKQTFDHPNNRVHLPRIQKMFGWVLVDESHLVPSELYSIYMNRFWAKRRQGCTATHSRKDGMECVTEEILGPVIHEIPIKDVGRVPLQVFFHFSGVVLKPKSVDFVNMLGILAGMKSRNEFIKDLMQADVNDGHTIIAVTDRKEQIIELERMLQAQDIRVERFTGDIQNRKRRTEILDRMRSGQSQVMLAMRSMTTGLDIPRASAFYNLLPSSNAVRSGRNAGEGGYEQQCSRVLTNFPGKEFAVCRDILDGIDLAWGCYHQRMKTYKKIGARIIEDKNAKKKQESAQQELFLPPAASNKF